MNTHFMATSTERPAPRRRVPAEERREDVLRVAADVVARDGMHAASTAEIAKRAGISHAYLFRLFPTKEALLLEVSHRAGDAMHQGMIAAGERAKQLGDDPLVAMAVEWTNQLRDHTNSPRLPAVDHRVAVGPRARRSAPRGVAGGRRRHRPSLRCRAGRGAPVHRPGHAPAGDRGARPRRATGRAGCTTARCRVRLVSSAALLPIRPRWRASLASCAANPATESPPIFIDAAPRARPLFPSKVSKHSLTTQGHDHHAEPRPPRPTCRSATAARRPDDRRRLRRGVHDVARQSRRRGRALPSIRSAMGGSMESLEWTVNAYTLTFAVTMIAMAALGDRFGRRRVFAVGIGVFTGASAAAALSSSVDALVAARAIQGLGAAAILPLSLTIISSVVRPDPAIGSDRHLGGGVSGLASRSAVRRRRGGRGHQLGVDLLAQRAGRPAPAAARAAAGAGVVRSGFRLDVPGLVLAGVGLFALTFGVVRAPALGWESATVGRLARRGRLDARRVRALGASGPGADAAPAVLPQPCVRAHQSPLDRDVLRDLRSDLPAQPVSSRRRRDSARSRRVRARSRGRRCRWSSRRSPVRSSTRGSAGDR